LVFIGNEHAAELRNAEVKRDDLLLNITGDGITFGRACRVDHRVLPACVNQHVSIVRVDASIAHPGYILSYLTHPQIKQYIESFNAGGSRRAITKGHIESFEIPLPPLAQQNRIADILTAFDDKIELNQRLTNTLEAIARTQFKRWFIDFDLVRSNAAGPKPRGLGSATAKVFPNQFENSELGPIPAGWRVGAIAEVAENIRRSVQPHEIEPTTAYIGLDHMPRRRIALSEWGQADSLESNKSQFSRGDILFGKLRPYFHKVGVAPIDGVCSTDILVITPKEPNWFGFLLCHVSSDEMIAHTDRASTGTKMPRTNWQDIARFRVAIPPAVVAEAFNAQVAPMIARIHLGIHESRQLAAARDSLLPRLLSGELSSRL